MALGKKSETSALEAEVADLKKEVAALKRALANVKKSGGGAADPRIEKMWAVLSLRNWVK